MSFLFLKNLYSAASKGLVKDIIEICQTSNGKKDLNQEDKVMKVNKTDTKIVKNRKN